LFFYWACCRKAIETLCPLFSIWLCVASSQEFRQHLAFIEKAQDDMVFDTYLSEANPWFFPHNWIYSLVSSGRDDTAPCINALHFHEASMLNGYLLSSHLARLLAR